MARASSLLAPGIVDDLLEFRDELGLDFNETPELFGPLKFDLRALELVINIRKIAEGRSDYLVIAFDSVAEAIKPIHQFGLALTNIFATPFTPPNKRTTRSSRIWPACDLPPLKFGPNYEMRKLPTSQ